ncbi:transglutaminase [Aquimarina algiphila]|uniref:transglutaminase n=1 Tax=Aquimarina algiphila TaxID=2047982 RepID=UPI00232BC789|nr:transglutaminase [Aquimarina algiphila]
MKNLEKLVLGFILMVSISSFAQEYKFGQVSKEELLASTSEIDSTADAEVLYENKKIYFRYDENDGFKLITEVFKRIKLYDKNGFDYGTDKVLLYKRGNDDEKITGLKGVTYTLKDGSVIETKLKKDGIFENEYSEFYDQVKFTMPSLQEGSVIEYKYRITSPFVFNIDRIHLQRRIPIKKLDVYVESPEYFNFKKLSTGYLPVNLKESSKNDKIRYTSKSRTGNGLTSARATFSNREIDYTVNTYTITSQDVPAFKEEPYSGNPYNYISSIIFELQYTKYPSGETRNYSTTWESVANRIYNNDNFGGELKKSNYYKEDMDQLLKGIVDPSERMLLIYRFVKDRMNWNKKYSVYTRDGVRKAYKENTGNVAEINLMLTSMLRYAKIDVNPILVSSSNKPAALFPTLDGFNYVISRVKLPNGNVYYLDATDKYALPNILPDRVIRGSGRVIAKNGTSQRIDLRPTEPSTNRYMIQCQMDKEGMIDGKFNVRHMEYFAHDFRVINGAKDDESKIERFKKRFGIDEIEEYTVKGVKEYGKGVSESFNFKSYDQIELIDNEMYFSPLLFLRDKENVFKSDERAYPIDFGHGFTNTYMVSIKIPEGYEVAEMPKAGGFKMPENVGAFSFKSNVSNGTIQVIVNETVNTPFLNAEYYLVLKQFYNQLIEKENEQIVLKKI